MNKQLIKKKTYIGSEVQWSVEDVYEVARNMKVGMDYEDAERVLIATFQDNEAIMGFIIEEIGRTIEYMDEENLIDLRK